MNQFDDARDDAHDGTPLTLLNLLLALLLVAAIAALGVWAWTDDAPDIPDAAHRAAAAQAAVEYGRSLVPLTVQQAYEKGLADAMAARPPNGVAALAACGWYPLGQQGRQP